MNGNTKLTIVILLAAVLILGASQVFFTVDEREQALVLQLGEPVGDVNRPGLHLKLPFVQNVLYFDARILSVDPQPEQMVIASDSEHLQNRGGTPNEKSEDAARDEIISGEPIIVDTFARYRITDPLMFYKSLRTIDQANARIESIMNDATRSILGKTTLNELLSKERGRVMQEIRDRVNRKVADDELGIEIIDIRIVRADLTPDLRQSTVRRMISELKERATETRARGEEEALRIRSTADKERTVILAEAEREAQILRGEGDKTAIRTYTGAFNKDPDFYAFIRSLEAYRNTLATPDTRLILSPESAFFRYFDGDGIK